MVKNSLLILLVVLCVSCDKQRVFDKYKTLPNSWHKDSIVIFKFNPKDSINPHNLFVNLRNTNAYKYNNLFLIVEVRFPHGKTIKDTLEYKMAEPSGKLLGSGIGDTKENKLWYKENVIFNEFGEYEIRIQHAMREHGKVNGIMYLDGITDVGFRVENTQ